MFNNEITNDIIIIVNEPNIKPMHRWFTNVYNVNKISNMAEKHLELKRLNQP